MLRSPRSKRQRLEGLDAIAAVASGCTDAKGAEPDVTSAYGTAVCLRNLAQSSAGASFYAGSAQQAVAAEPHTGMPDEARQPRGGTAAYRSALQPKRVLPLPGEAVAAGAEAALAVVSAQHEAAMGAAGAALDEVRAWLAAHWCKELEPGWRVSVSFRPKALVPGVKAEAGADHAGGAGSEAEITFVSPWGTRCSSKEAVAVALGLLQAVPHGSAPPVWGGKDGVAVPGPLSALAPVTSALGGLAAAVSSVCQPAADCVCAMEAASMLTSLASCNEKVEAALPMVPVKPMAAMPSLGLPLPGLAQALAASGQFRSLIANHADSKAQCEQAAPALGVKKEPTSDPAVGGPASATGTGDRQHSVDGDDTPGPARSSLPALKLRHAVQAVLSSAGAAHSMLEGREKALMAAAPPHSIAYRVQAAQRQLRKERFDVAADPFELEQQGQVGASSLMVVLHEQGALHLQAQKAPGKGCRYRAPEQHPLEAPIRRGPRSKRKRSKTAPGTLHAYVKFLQGQPVSEQVAYLLLVMLSLPQPPAAHRSLPKPQEAREFMGGAEALPAVLAPVSVPAPAPTAPGLNSLVSRLNSQIQILDGAQAAQLPDAQLSTAQSLPAAAATTSGRTLPTQPQPQVLLSQSQPHVQQTQSQSTQPMAQQQQQQLQLQQAGVMNNAGGMPMFVQQQQGQGQQPRLVTQNGQVMQLGGAQLTMPGGQVLQLGGQAINMGGQVLQLQQGPNGQLIAVSGTRPNILHIQQPQSQPQQQVLQQITVNGQQQMVLVNTGGHNQAHMRPIIVGGGQAGAGAHGGQAVMLADNSQNGTSQVVQQQQQQPTIVQAQQQQQSQQQHGQVVQQQQQQAPTQQQQQQHQLQQQQQQLMNTQMVMGPNNTVTIVQRPQQQQMQQQQQAQVPQQQQQQPQQQPQQPHHHQQQRIMLIQTPQGVMQVAVPAEQLQQHQQAAQFIHGGTGGVMQLLQGPGAQLMLGGGQQLQTGPQGQLMLVQGGAQQLVESQQQQQQQQQIVGAAQQQGGGGMRMHMVNGRLMLSQDPAPAPMMQQAQPQAINLGGLGLQVPMVLQAVPGGGLQQMQMVQGPGGQMLQLPQELQALQAAQGGGFVLAGQPRQMGR